MRIFSKKEEDEESFDEQEKRKRFIDRRNPKNKDFKDLKPENKRKRKGPPKPWGRKERIFIFLVLIISILTSGLLAASARAWRLPGLPRMKLSTLSLKGLSIFKEETIVIGSKDNQVTQVDQKKIEEIKNYFENSIKNLSGIYALHVYDLEAGYGFGVNENEVMQAASLIKLPALAALYKEAESGNINLDEEYRLKQTDKVGGAGSLYTKPTGTLITFQEMAELTGQQSDNTAFTIIRKSLGDEKINKVISEIGMDNTSLTQNKTSAEDIGNFFEKLWKGEIVSEESRDEILEYLTNTTYEDWLVAGIPKDVRVAHKYGREIHVVNDAGIVFAEPPFVLVVMTGGVVEKEANEIFPQLSKTIFEIFTKE